MGRSGRSRERQVRDEYFLGTAAADHRVVRRAAGNSLPPQLNAHESSSSEEDEDELDTQTREGVDPPLLDGGEGEWGG